MLRILTAGAIVLLASCGPKPPPDEPPPPEPEEEEAEGQGMEIVGLTGSLSQSEVNDTMQMKAIPAFNLCFQFYLEERGYLYGEITLGFKILESGKVNEVTLLSSTYGDYELEQCFVGKSKFLKFPKPHGGPAEASYNFSTDVIEGATAPGQVSAIKLEQALSPYAAEMEECLGGKDTGHSITFHVGDSMTEEVEDESGKTVTRTTSRVLTLGGYGPSGERAGVECLFEASKNWTLEMDVDGVGKATLSL